MEKKKSNHGASALLCFFYCVFADELIITFANSHRILKQIAVEEAEPFGEPSSIKSYAPLDDEKPSVATPFTQVSGAIKSMRQRPPSSYCLNMQSFNTLVKYRNTEKYESRPFPAGGYNWTLIVYPKGNKNDNGSDYISLYVAIDNSSLTASPGEVYADLKFFVYNKNEDKYLTIQDTEAKRFHALRKVWGYSQVISLKTFSDPKNGYLYDGEHCMFGVDVFVTPLFDKWELFTVTESFDYPKFTWKIRNFSKLDKDIYLSGVFSVGGRRWYLQLYPDGTGAGKGNSVSLFLTLDKDENLKPYEKIYLRAKLRILDQIQSKHVERQISVWYSVSAQSWGYRQFVSFADLQDSSKGLIVNDALKAEVEFETLSRTSYFPSYETAVSVL